MNQDKLKEIFNKVLEVNEKTPFSASFKYITASAHCGDYLIVDVSKEDNCHYNRLYSHVSREESGTALSAAIPNLEKFITGTSVTFNVTHADEFLKMDKTFFNISDASTFCDEVNEKYNIDVKPVKELRV